MEVDLNNTRYLFQWHYVPDEQKTLDFIKANPAKSPRKAHQYNGMAICRVKVRTFEKQDTDGPDGTSLADKPVLETVCEGLSFCRKGDRWDKRAARKLSLKHAVEAKDSGVPLFNYAERTRIWQEFNDIYPPETNIWKRLYKVVHEQNTKLHEELNRLRDERLQAKMAVRTDG